MRHLMILSALVMLAGACRPAKNTAVGVGEGTKEGAESTVEAVKEAPKNTDDMAISTAIKGKLADDELVNASHIDVDTDNGIVYLKGHQDNEQAKSRAEQVARQTDGVKGVVNQIVVSK